MELLIITGLSGAGKTCAADICEDLNYYCVDNLPAALLPRFAALCSATKGRYERAALVMEVRSEEDYSELYEALRSLEDIECTCRILFLEAEFETIIRRYKESRRPHPLSNYGGSIREAVEREIRLLSQLRAGADFVINTTGLSLNRLKGRIYEILSPGSKYFTVHLSSFGYKHGIPPEADMVFDVRCLPNPFYELDLRDLTGLDKPVSDYVFRSEAAQQYLNRLEDLITYLIPLFREDRSELHIAIGCTGGHHRSVAMTQALAEDLERLGLAPTVSHRDLERAP